MQKFRDKNNILTKLLSRMMLLPPIQDGKSIIYPIYVTPPQCITS